MARQRADLDRVAAEAVQWSIATFAERTRRIEAGEVNIDWILPEARLTWSEIHTAFPALRSVDGRLAYDRALKQSKAWRALWRKANS